MILLLLVPGSSSVLCIAPGSHVRIETLHAPCCADSSITHALNNQGFNDIEDANSCHGCTDLLLTSNENGILPQTGTPGSPDGLNGECIEICDPADVSIYLCRSDLTGNADRLVFAGSSTPLRC